MKHLLPALLALVLLASCGGKKNLTFTIEGQLENGANKTLYIKDLLPNSEEPHFVDSIHLDSKGHFTFTYKMPYQSFYNIYVNEVDYVVLLPNGGEKINFTANYENITQTYQVQGSPESTLLWQLQNYANEANAQLQEIVQLDKKNRIEICGSLDKKYWSKQDSVRYRQAKDTTNHMFEELMGGLQDYISHFIIDNKGSLATIIALYKPFNNYPIIDPRYNFDYYEEVLVGLQETIPDNPHTQHFYNVVQKLRHQFSERQAGDMMLEESPSAEPVAQK